MNSLLNY